MAPSPRPRALKRPGAVILAVLLVLAASLALAEAFGWPFLRGPLENLMVRQLERPVRVGKPFRLHLLGSVRLQAGELWIAAPPGFDAPHLVSAQGLAVELRYRDLMAMRRTPGLRIADMVVGSLDAHLLREADGRSTWQSPREAQAEPSPPPRVDHLVVASGQVILRDAVSGVDLTTRFDTREGEAAEAPVTHVASSGKFGKRPLRAELTTPGLLAAAASGGKPDQALPARGWVEYGGVRVDFDGSVTDVFGERRLEGAVVVKGPSLAVFGDLVGSVLPTSPPFVLKGRVRSEPPVWHLQVDSARVGSSQLAGQFSFDPSPPRAQLNGELRGRRFVLADLAPAFGTRSPEGKKLAPPPGRALPDRPLDLPSLKTMDAHVAVDLQYVDLGSAFAQPITPLKGKLTLEEGRLALHDLVANTARGDLSGSIAVEADRERWQADLAWRGIRLEDWIKASRPRREPEAAPRQVSDKAAQDDDHATGEDATGKEGSGKEGGKEGSGKEGSGKEGSGKEGSGKGAAGKDAPPPYFTGQLQGRAKLHAHGRSTAKLLGTLEGEGTVFVRNGSLSHLVVEALGLDVAQALGVLLRGDEDLPLRCAVLDFSAHEGRITPRVAVLDTPVTLVQIDGTADLAQERLDLTVVAKPRNVSPLTLRSPLRVRGSFVAPRVSVQPAPIAARVAGGLLLGAINPLAAILPFLDPGERSEPPCATLQASRKK